MNKRLLAAGIFMIFVGLAWIFGIPEPQTANPDAVVSVQAKSGFPDQSFYAGSILLIIGIVLTFRKVRLFRRERSTGMRGTETYGIITEIINTGMRVRAFSMKYSARRSTLLKVRISIMGKSGTVFELTKSFYASNSSQPYGPGNFVRVMYLNDDVNILEVVRCSSVPTNIADRLEEEYRLMTQD